VDVVAIDSRNVNLAFLLSAWNVQILPSLYILPVHVSHRQGLGQGLAGVGGVKRPVEYTEQDLHPDSIRNWALKQLPANLVERIDDTKLAGLQAGVAQAQSSVALLFTDKESTPPLLRRLSLQFAHRIAFVEINGKRSPKAAKHFKATTFPTLLVVPGPGYSADRNPVAYKGALKISEIVDFLSPYAPSPEERERVRRLTEESAIRLEARRLAEDVLEIATASDWEQDVLSRQAVVGVLFGSRVNSADEVKEKLAVLADAKQRSGRNSVVSQYFYIDVSEAESGKSRLQQQLGGASDDGSPVLVFLHPSKGLFLRFAGAFTVQGVMQFVSGKVRSGMTGAKSVTTSALKADF
jgi:hypothetical protein